MTIDAEAEELRAAWAALGLAIKWAALRDAVKIRRAWRRLFS